MVRSTIRIRENRDGGVKSDIEMWHAGVSGAAKGGQYDLFKEVYALSPSVPDEHIIKNAVESGNIELLKYIETLLPVGSLGPTSDGTKEDKRTTVKYKADFLGDAARSGNQAMYDYVLAKVGANMAISRRDGIFEAAAASGNVALIKNVVASIGKPEEKYTLRNALKYAVSGGHLDMMKYLVSIHDYGKASEDDDPIMRLGLVYVINHAIASGKLDVLKYVLAKVSPISKYVSITSIADSERPYVQFHRPDKVIYTDVYNPALLAILYGRLDMLKEILAASGPRTTLKSAIKNAPSKAIHNAVLSGDVEVLKYLIASGLKPSEMTYKDASKVVNDLIWSPQHNLDMLKYGLSVLQYTQDDINEALRGAAEIGRRDMAKYLLSLGATLPVKRTPKQPRLKQTVVDFVRALQ